MTYEGSESVPMLVDPLLYRPEQVARLLNISRTAVYDLIRTGDLASVRTGRARRIPRCTIESFIEQRISSAEST